MRCIAQEYTGNNYFYTGKKYGSEAMFNPWNHILNESFDILQINNLEDNYRQIFSADYSNTIKNLAQCIANPISNIKNFGTKDFFKTQIIPNTNDFQWLPNYTLHVFGGGMSYAMMKEWYEYHGFSSSGIWSAATIMAGHLGNEIIESMVYKNYKNNVDAIADLFIFDVAGIVLFSIKPIRKFFGRNIQLTDWSPQPSLTLNSLSLMNNGKYYAMKIGIPRVKKLSIFSHMGIGNIFGLSLKTDNEHSISMGAGTKMKQILGVGTDISYKTTSRFGVFYDKNNSLLASLIVNNEEQYFCNINIYPGIVKLKNFSPGFWSVITKHGNVSMGISTRFSIGLGFN